MKGQLKLSPLAQYDLSEIWDYTKRLNGTLIRPKLTYAGLPRPWPYCRRASAGTTMSHIREGYRRFPCGAHILFYRLKDLDVEIVRILHKSMDFNRRLD